MDYIENGGVIDARMMGKLTNTIRQIFEIPSWHLPSEINRLYEYVGSERNIQRAKIARAHDCSAFCQGAACYFCLNLEPVFYHAVAGSV